MVDSGGEAGGWEPGGWGQAEHVPESTEVTATSKLSRGAALSGAYLGGGRVERGGFLEAIGYLCDFIQTGDRSVMVSGTLGEEQSLGEESGS